MTENIFQHNKENLNVCVICFIYNKPTIPRSACQGCKTRENQYRLRSPDIHGSAANLLLTVFTATRRETRIAVIAAVRFQKGTG